MHFWHIFVLQKPSRDSITFSYINQIVCNTWNLVNISIDGYAFVYYLNKFVLWFGLIIITNTRVEGEGAAKSRNNLTCPYIYIYIYIYIYMYVSVCICIYFNMYTIFYMFANNESSPIIVIGAMYDNFYINIHR